MRVRDPKKNDPSITRYFTLEHDYVLATKSTRTQLCEREGQRTQKIGEGPKVTGDFQADAGAFDVDCGHGHHLADRPEPKPVTRR